MSGLWQQVIESRVWRISNSEMAPGLLVDDWGSRPSDFIEELDVSGDEDLDAEAACEGFMGDELRKLIEGDWQKLSFTTFSGFEITIFGRAAKQNAVL